jgi:hypothetical protein
MVLRRGSGGADAVVTDLKVQCAALVQTIEKLAGDNEDMATRLNTASIVRDTPVLSEGPGRSPPKAPIQLARKGSGTTVPRNSGALQVSEPSRVGPSKAAVPREGPRTRVIDPPSGIEGVPRGPAPHQSTPTTLGGPRKSAAQQAPPAKDVARGVPRAVPQGPVRPVVSLLEAATTFGAAQVRRTDVAWGRQGHHARILGGKAGVSKAGPSKTAVGTGVGTSILKKGSQQAGPSWWEYFTGLAGQPN